MAEPARERKLPVDDKIHTWPHLVRGEFLVTLFVIVVLTLWALLIDAPLEEPANPTRTPNPSKAPWYFLGLQEMLVYFDPWHAGVVLPSLIIVGLMVIPFIDINPKGNGYYCLLCRYDGIVLLVRFAGQRQGVPGALGNGAIYHYRSADRSDALSSCQDDSPAAIQREVRPGYPLAEYLKSI